MASLNGELDAAPMPLDEKGETPEKRPPGRPKGSPNKTPSTGRTPANVTAALAVMQGFYDFLTMGVAAINPVQAMELQRRTANLQSSNKTFFESDPKLAARIAKIGATGGTSGFILANVVTLAPIIIPVAKEATPMVMGLVGKFFGGADNERTDPAS